MIALGGALLFTIRRFDKQRDIIRQVNDTVFERSTLLNRFILLSERVQSDLLLASVMQSMGVPDKKERVFQAENLAGQKTDLAISDMSMPKMSGDQLAIELIKVCEDVRILLCTGHSDAIDEKKAKEIGIKGFAMKPLDTGKLAKGVCGVLDQNRAA
jgi:DNA-binding NarL/FixJ family response regulator